MNIDNLKKKWYIHPNYVHRVDVFLDGKIEEKEDFPASVYVDSDEKSKEYQIEIYEYAKKIFSLIGGERILDIGCGTAYKTKKYFDNEDFIGLEIEPMLTYLRKRYPNNIWLDGRSEKVPPGYFSLVICADVIEHIVDPDNILNFIEEIDFNYCIISTPDRDSLNLREGKKWDNYKGPPRNTSHIREWSFKEFGEYIGSRFDIVAHFRCLEPDYKSQLIMIRK